MTIPQLLKKHRIKRLTYDDLVECVKRKVLHVSCLVYAEHTSIAECEYRYVFFAKGCRRVAKLHEIGHIVRNPKSRWDSWQWNGWARMMNERQAWEFAMEHHKFTDADYAYMLWCLLSHEMVIADTYDK